MKDFKIKLLWRVSAYDGLIEGVGEYKNKYVYLLSNGPNIGGRHMKKEWLNINNTLYNLLTVESYSCYDNFMYDNYQEEMYEDRIRMYEVYLINENIFSLLKHNHRLYQLHIGLTSDFFYKNGKIKKIKDCYWHNSYYYEKIHYYEKIKKVSVDDIKKESKLINLISKEELYNYYSDYNSEPLKDPRTEELKKYQENWKIDHETKFFI